MEATAKMIKDDINFLEYPNWVISKKKNLTMWSIQKSYGKYEIVCPIGLPKHFDKIVLYSLLYKLYREKNLNEYVLMTNRYEIAKNIFETTHFGKNVYKRIMRALKKWASLFIHFEGVFYEADGYTERSFHILDEVVFRPKTGELMIRFNESYVTQIRETKFYKLIDFEQYKKLSKTSSARLYEILLKSFKDRGDWAINIQSLAEKLTFEKRENAQNYYPSEVLRYLKPSVNEINKKTDLEIEFSYNKESGVCIFKKLAKKKIVLTPAKKIAKINYKQQIVECYSYFKTLSVEEQKVILDDIKRYDFLKCVPEKDARIFAYMRQIKQWQPREI